MTDRSAPKGRHLNLGYLRVWWTLSSDLWFGYLPDRSPVVGGRRNCDVWFADY